MTQASAYRSFRRRYTRTRPSRLSIHKRDLSLNRMLRHCISHQRWCTVANCARLRRCRKVKFGPTYGRLGLKPISIVTVWSLILWLWVPGVVLAVKIAGINRLCRWVVLMCRSWRRVVTRGRGRPGRGRSDVLPVCRKRFRRRSIVLTWHRNCCAITDEAMLATNMPIALSRSMGVNLGIVKQQCVS